MTRKRAPGGSGARAGRHPRLGRERYERHAATCGDRQGDEAGTVKTAAGVLRWPVPHGRGLRDPKRAQRWGARRPRRSHSAPNGDGLLARSVRVRGRLGGPAPWPAVPRCGATLDCRLALGRAASSGAFPSLGALLFVIRRGSCCAGGASSSHP